MDWTMKWADVGYAEIKEMMTLREKVLVGSTLISLFIRSTGLADVKHEYSRGRDYETGPGRVASKKTIPVYHVFLEPRDGVMEWLRNRNEWLELAAPINLPMCVEPLQWAPGVDGGYRFALKDKYELVRRGRAYSDEGRLQLAVAEMPDFYESLNAVQSTAWTINTEVMHQVKDMFSKGYAKAGLPSSEPLEQPPKPHDILTNKTARRKWTEASFAVHEADFRRRAKCRDLERILGVVKRLWKYPRIYFPHNADWRGRFYPIPDYLTPQGTDVSRALLKFADGKPLGEEGVFWLAVGGAGLMKEDPETHLNIASISLDQRAQWTLAHSDMIKAVADDPWETMSWWECADKPLQFYAFCLEWKNYLEQGPEYSCSLPIHVDAVSSGLQHMAASYRDPDLASTVSLVPGERPTDQYQIITDVVLAMLADWAHGHDDPAKREAAGIWLNSDLITRSLIKRPTMTFSYGAKERVNPTCWQDP
jgi:DNA-directed RNA polymerase